MSLRALEVGRHFVHFLFVASFLIFFFLVVYHGSEVAYVYGGVSNPSASNRKLSSVMIDYWVSFTARLNPNDGHGISCQSRSILEVIYD